MLIPATCGEYLQVICPSSCVDALLTAPAANTGLSCFHKYFSSALIKKKNITYVQKTVSMLAKNLQKWKGLVSIEKTRRGQCKVHNSYSQHACYEKTTSYVHVTRCCKQNYSTCTHDVHMLQDDSSKTNSCVWKPYSHMLIKYVHACVIELHVSKCNIMQANTVWLAYHWPL